MNRREFVVASGAALAASVAGGSLGSSAATGPHTRTAPQDAPASRVGEERRGGPCAIASANGLVALARALELLAAGTPLLDALVAGVKIVEDDPNDDSVGYGGLPNEEGVVELDASVMDGRLHRAGAVGALRNIRNPAAVALAVLRRTDHVMLVGDGALRFAKAVGFVEENLLTEHARTQWLRWKANLNRGDKWLDDDQQIRAEPGPQSHRLETGDVHGGIRVTTGTVHCSGLDADGNLAAVTSTSGLAWKIPGRLGDSPIVGAGMYCDNAVGSAGATGRGEAVIQVCGAFSIVEHMAQGLSPTEACLAVLTRIADRTRERRLLDRTGRPAFHVILYALRKDGACGAASLWAGRRFAVHDGRTARLEPCAFLYDGSPQL